ncbi:MAG: ABC transporter permease subunit [Planctomycetota bacterium]
MRAILSFVDPRSLFGPVFFKEMLVAGRRAFSHWVRFAAGVLLAFFLWLIVSQSVLPEISWESGFSRIQAYSAIAPAITLIVGIIMAVLLPVVASAFGAGTMIDEKNARTIESILATPMSAWSVVASKVMSRVMQLLILALIALPVLLASRAFGGVSLVTITGFFAVGLCQAVFACAVATWSSMRVQKAWTAMVTGVSACVFLSVLPFVPVYATMLGQTPGTLAEWALRIALHTSPAGALALLGAPEDAGSGFELFPGSPWVVTSLFCLLLATLVMLATASRVRKETAGKPRAKIKRDAKGEPKAIASGSNARSRTVRGNPVGWREIHRPIIRGGKKLKIFSAFALLAILLLVYLRVEPDNEGLHYSVAMLCFFIAMLMPLNSTTGAINGEREARSLDVLLSTPLSARSILLGKLLGVFPTPLFTLQFVSLHVVIYTALGLLTGDEFVSPMLVLYAMVIGAGTCAMLGGTGLLFGTLFCKSSVAMVANIGLWVALWIIVPITVGFLDLYYRYDAVEHAIAFINPFVLFADSLDGAVARGWGGRDIPHEYGSTVDRDDGPIAWLVFLAIWAVLASGVGLAATWIASRVLASRTLRSA